MNNELKFSKSAIFSAVIAILCAIGFINSGITYTNLQTFIIAILVDVLILFWFYHILKTVKEKNLRGELLAKIGFYGFLAGFILWLVLSLLLLQKISGIKDFAISVTPKVLTSDLKALKDYSTPDLAKVVEYDSEFSAYKEKIKGVGAIKNCAFSDGDSIEVAFVPVTNSDGTSYRYTASYSVRCYGENKMIAVGIVLVNKEKQWQISDFAFNANITKDTDVEALETDSED